MLFPHKMTIFNIWRSDDCEITTRTVIDKCLFVLDENTERNKLGLANADTVRVTVPRGQTKVQTGYVDPFAYQQLEEESLAKFFTFAKGDYIALGDVSLGDMDFNDFKNIHGNLYEITGVSDYNYGTLRHFKIQAK